MSEDRSRSLAISSDHSPFVTSNSMDEEALLGSDAYAPHRRYANQSLTISILAIRSYTPGLDPRIQSRCAAASIPTGHRPVTR